MSTSRIHHDVEFLKIVKSSFLDNTVAVKSIHSFEDVEIVTLLTRFPRNSVPCLSNIFNDAKLLKLIISCTKEFKTSNRRQRIDTRINEQMHVKEFKTSKCTSKKRHGAMNIKEESHAGRPRAVHIKEELHVQRRGVARAMHVKERSFTCITLQRR